MGRRARVSECVRPSPRASRFLNAILSPLAFLHQGYRLISMGSVDSGAPCRFRESSREPQGSRRDPSQPGGCRSFRSTE